MLLQEGTETFTGAGFAEVSSQLLVPETDDRDNTRLADEIIAGIVVAVTAAAIIILVILITAIIWSVDVKFMCIVMTVVHALVQSMQYQKIIQIILILALLFSCIHMKNRSDHKDIQADVLENKNPLTE